MTLFLRAAVIPLFVVSFVTAQQVKPTTLTTEAVPGYTSPPQRVRFINTGAGPLALTISLDGPFAIPQNHCGRGVKPQTHCDVYVTYTPKAIETDTGTLTFTFGVGQFLSIPLIGNGVTVIPTTLNLKHWHNDGEMDIDRFEMTAGVLGENYIIPNSDVVSVVCDGGHNGSGYLVNNKTTVEVEFGSLDCEVHKCTAWFRDYLNPPEFGYSEVTFWGGGHGKYCKKDGGPE